MKLGIPGSLAREHAELHEELARLTKVEGEIGEAAREVAALLHPHFVAEEEYALPPLALLGALVDGPVTPEMKAVLAMTDRLKAELPRMLAEHKAIVGALRKLIAIVKREGKVEDARFAEKLLVHAWTEEEILYPAAILVGAYVRCVSGEGRPR